MLEALGSVQVFLPVISVYNTTKQGKCQEVVKSRYLESWDAELESALIGFSGVGDKHAVAIKECDCRGSLMFP